MIGTRTADSRKSRAVTTTVIRGRTGEKRQRPQYNRRERAARLALSSLSVSGALAFFKNIPPKCQTFADKLQVFLVAPFSSGLQQFSLSSFTLYGRRARILGNGSARQATAAGRGRGFQLVQMYLSYRQRRFVFGMEAVNPLLREP